MERTWRDTVKMIERMSRRDPSYIVLLESALSELKSRLEVLEKTESAESSTRDGGINSLV